MFNVYACPSYGRGSKRCLRKRQPGGHWRGAGGIPQGYKAAFPNVQVLVRNYLIRGIVEVAANQPMPAGAPGVADTIWKFEQKVIAGTWFAAVAGSNLAHVAAANDILGRLALFTLQERTEFFAYARHWRDERIF